MSLTPTTRLPSRDEDVLPWTGLTVAQARVMVEQWRSRRGDEVEILLIARGLLLLLGHEAAGSAERDADGLLLLPGAECTLECGRSRLSAWHFAKESLRDRERTLLYVAEGLLRLLDVRATGRDLR